VSGHTGGAGRQGVGTFISDCSDPYARVTALGLNPLGALSILPRGFESGSPGDLCHEAEAATSRKLWNQSGVFADQVQRPDGKLPSVVQRSADWVAPTIFVGGMLFSQNPLVLQLAVEVLGSYLSDVLKGRSKPTVRLTFVVEQRGAKVFKKCEYEGPVDGLAQLPEVLRNLHDGNH